jgi:hypothetical protein
MAGTYDARQWSGRAVMGMVVVGKGGKRVFVFASSICLRVLFGYEFQ